MKKNIDRKRALAFPLLIVLSACGSGGGGGNTGTGGGAGGGGTGGGGGNTLIPTIESIQTNVFDQLCISCHIGATAPGGLRLDDANAFALLVGVASVQNAALLRVDPGNPDDSYLIDKLEGTHTVGGRMPLGGTPMPQADIDVVRQWITDGAMPAMAPPPTAPIRVSSLSPVPGSSMPMVPMTIMAVFDRELSAASVDATTFLVTRSGGDGTFDDGNEVAIVADSVSVSMMNPMTATFDMSSSTAVSDTYQVTLVGSGGTTIQDLDANALDGEFSGAFPSGDGTAGGDFVAEFTVDGIQPTLTSIQDNIFTPTCAGCHSGPGGAAGLDLTSLSASFNALVNVASAQVGTLSLVNPGDADNSYLIQKLEGTAAVGAQMPRFAPALDQATIDTVRQWITDGATM
ncbi:MAG: Ig-like domain-containing protein [Gammaproteobacteria bacterium]